MDKINLPPPNAEPVINIGLVVQNLQASIHFYENILQMQPVHPHFVVTPEQSHEMNFAGNLPFNIYRYQTTNGNTPTTLKLIEFVKEPPQDEPMEPTPIPVPPRPAQSGINGYAGVNYLTFSYTSADELSAIVKAMRSENVEVLGEISAAYFDAAYVRDPDGVFIELLYPHS